jgi:hypothetical protein
MKKAENPRRCCTPDGNFDFKDRRLLDLDDMDNQEASDSTLKSTRRRSYVDDTLGMLCQPFEAVRASTRQEVRIFIFICFCSMFEALTLVYRPTTYYANAQSLSSTSYILSQTVEMGFSVVQARKTCRDKGLDRRAGVSIER